MRNIAALVLAAGSSRRLGQPKQLLDWGGRPLLDVVLDQVRTWPVSDIWVVLGAHAEEILDACDLTGVKVVINDDFEEGMASSLRCGLDALTRIGNAEGAFVAMGDQPDIDLGVVEKLAGAYEMSTERAFVPKYRYTWSNPVLVDRALWPRMMSLEGDQGAQKLLKAHSEWVHEVWFEELPPRDVDTAVDVEEMSPRSAK